MKRRSFGPLALALALASGCPRRAPPRPERSLAQLPSPLLSRRSEPSVPEVERLLEQTRLLARAGGAEARLQWFRASCADERGAIVQRCSGLTWSGTPVFGVPAPGMIPVQGFLSAQWQRRRDGGGTEHFGVSILAGDPHTQRLEGAWEELDEGPRCRFADALARAVARGFAPTPGFKVVFEADRTPARATWTFHRDQTEVAVSDECPARALGGS